jgi:hypothetical protein
VRRLIRVFVDDEYQTSGLNEQVNIFLGEHAGGT